MRGGAAISLFNRFKKDAESVLLSRLKKEKPLSERDWQGFSLVIIEKMLPFWRELSGDYRLIIITKMRERGLLVPILLGLMGKNRQLSAEDAAAYIIGLGSEYFRGELEGLLFTENPCIPARLEEVLAHSPWAEELMGHLDEMPLPRQVILLTALAKAKVPGVALYAMDRLPSVPPERQLEFITLLGYSGDLIALHCLSNLLDHKNWRIQIRAIHALMEFDHHLVLPYLQKREATMEGPAAFALAAALADIRKEGISIA